jgi:hypothetical protein
VVFSTLLTSARDFWLRGALPFVGAVAITCSAPPISAGASLMLTGGLGSQLVGFVGGVESHRRELPQCRGVE